MDWYCSMTDPKIKQGQKEETEHEAHYKPGLD